MLIQGLASTAVLPEPLVTNVLSKNPNVKQVFDFEQEWQRVEDSSLPQAGMVVQNKFVEKYPEALDIIQKSYQQATEQTTADPSSVASLVQEKFDMPAKVFENSMARIDVRFVNAQDAKADVDNYLSKLLQFSPEMVGGKVPDDKFYLAK
ncbi:hypothetical protein N752_06715 [Desulforamulus aquiferis]|nr:hypothetical protein [Desulforamulus aquiferis]RYD05931.1 hypothetical protein N752_06715 [Desulforamulus aquiferis]